MPYCNVNISYTLYKTSYPVVVVSAALISPYLPGCTNDAMLSLMPSITTLRTSLQSSIDVVLFLSSTMFQVFNVTYIDYYVHSTTGW